MNRRKNGIDPAKAFGRGLPLVRRPDVV